MRSIKEVLRLRHQHQLSVREIARSCGLPVSTVGDYLKRAATAQIGWPIPDELDEAQLQERLLAVAPAEPQEVPASDKALPDWAAVHEQLRRKGVTLQLLWQEYRQAHLDGYRYSRYCELYRAWSEVLEPVLRQVHEPGEKLFVDWAGQTVPIHDPGCAETSTAHLFVAVLGASNRTYLEAFVDEKLESWITAHCHAYAYFGGVARITVPDYVPGNIIGIMCPTRLCGERLKTPVFPREIGNTGAHNLCGLPVANSVRSCRKGDCHDRPLLPKTADHRPHPGFLAGRAD